MKLSLQMTVVGAAVFAVLCLGFAIAGFGSLAGLSAQQADDARGYAWFWTFLGGIAVVFGVLAWWLSRAQGTQDNA